MEENNTVLCACSAYERKYYLNEEFNGLPDRVKNELQIACVIFTEDVGGILTIYFDEDGSLVLHPQKDETDVLYDDVGCGLKLRQLEMEKAELFEQMEQYYKVFIRQESSM
ncbi:MAG: hypothetical protein J6D02_12720 [Lachnospira sp.]|nr:hypothetical protein [Lachnospira sp.]